MERAPARSLEALAELVTSVAEAAGADAIVCATESGMLARGVQARVSRARVVAATPNEQTYRDLLAEGTEVFRLPIRAADEYRQVQLVLSVAVDAGLVSSGELVACAGGRKLLPSERDLIVLTDVVEGLQELSITDLVTLTDGIRPRALEAAIAVASKIGRAAGRGKRLGVIFMLGDSVKVLEGSRQLIPNPFKGHDRADRMITNPDIQEALVELAKLDGAFVIRGDGWIQSAGVFLAVERADVTLPAGLGARHVAAAATTGRSSATAVVVSATDGNVRIFSGGRLALQIAPGVPFGPFAHDA